MHNRSSIAWDFWNPRLNRILRFWQVDARQCFAGIMSRETVFLSAASNDMNRVVRMRKDGRHRFPSLALACGCCSVPAASARSQPADHHHHLARLRWRQTDSPLNDLIDVFNNTAGVEEGIQVEGRHGVGQQEISNGIITAAAGEPGSPKPLICSFHPKTVLALPDQSILVDYRDYFTEDELAAFVPAFLEDGVDGHLVCLPCQVNRVVLRQQTDFDRFSAATGVTP